MKLELERDGYKLNYNNLWVKSEKNKVYLKSRCYSCGQFREKVVREITPTLELSCDVCHSKTQIVLGGVKK